MGAITIHEIRSSFMMLVSLRRLWRYCWCDHFVALDICAINKWNILRNNLTTYNRAISFLLSISNRNKSKCYIPKFSLAVRFSRSQLSNPIKPMHGGIRLIPQSKSTHIFPAILSPLQIFLSRSSSNGRGTPCRAKFSYTVKQVW